MTAVCDFICALNGTLSSQTFRFRVIGEKEFFPAVAEKNGFSPITRKLKDLAKITSNKKLSVC